MQSAGGVVKIWLRAPLAASASLRRYASGRSPKGPPECCPPRTTTDRRGAPENVSFGDEADALESRERTYARVIETGDMPPAGGLSPDELERLEVFLVCGL